MAPSENAPSPLADSSEVPHSRSTRVLYSKEQLQAYFEFIGLPESLQSSPVMDKPEHSLSKEHGLPLLAALMRHHIATIPFENLSIHYSPHHDMTLDTQELFSNMVESGNGRGGYCMQMNSVFGTVLRSLGFEIMSGAARVNTACQAVAMSPSYTGPNYNGWDHMVNIVTISKQRYLVDVGIGAYGPMVPLPLVSGVTTVSITPRSIRLVNACIPEHTSSHASNAMWQLEVRNQDTDAWSITYAFSEIEFLPEDYEMMNWYTSTNRRSFWTHQVLAMKMVLSDDQQEVVGDITLFQRGLRRRIHGKVEIEVECGTEKERVEALQKYLGIKLSPAEQRAIKGMASEIL